MAVMLPAATNNPATEDFMRSILTILCLTALLDARAAVSNGFFATTTTVGTISIITPNALADLGDSESMVFINLETDHLAVLTPLPADRDTYVVLDLDGLITPIVWTRARQIAALGYRRVLIRWGWGC